MLIDWDNLQICHSRDAPGTDLDLNALNALAQSYGTLVSARAYAEWNLVSERLGVYKAGIEPVFAPVMRPEGSTREGKSLADTVMVADGVDLLWTVAPDIFVLVTSDKDMIPLARIAKQRGAAVVVLGSDLTAIPLVEISNVFITYRQLLRELDRVVELESPSGRAPARERRVLREARRPTSNGFGLSEQEPVAGSPRGMRAMPSPALAPAASMTAAPESTLIPTPAPSATLPASPLPPRRSVRTRPPSPAATPTPIEPDIVPDLSDEADLTVEGAARRRRRRGGRGRGRTTGYDEGGLGPESLESSSDTLDAAADISPDEAAFLSQVEALGRPDPLGTFESPEIHTVEVSAIPGVESPSGFTRRETSRFDPPRPVSTTFGQVRRGVSFSEFGAPASVAPLPTSEASIDVETPTPDVLVSPEPDAGSADVGTAVPADAVTEVPGGEVASSMSEPTVDQAAQVAAELEPGNEQIGPSAETGSLVPIGASVTGTGAASDDTRTRTNGSRARTARAAVASASDLAKAGSEETTSSAPLPEPRDGATDAEASVLAEVGAGASYSVGTLGEVGPETASTTGDDATADSSPKPVRRRRTRRTPPANKDATSE